VSNKIFIPKETQTRLFGPQGKYRFNNTPGFIVKEILFHFTCVGPFPAPSPPRANDWLEALSPFLTDSVMFHIVEYDPFIEVNLHHAINFRDLCGANLVT